MPTPFVRPYDPSRDFDNGLEVFFKTIDQGLDYEPARTIGSYIWYRPYPSLSPGTCFVLDDGNGRAVGYCIGTADTLSFRQSWMNDYAPSVDHKQVPPPETKTTDEAMEKESVLEMRNAVYIANCSTLLNFQDQFESYPAHLHINVLPEYQRKGHGKTLINAFLEKVKSAGAVGVHLGMVVTNAVAPNFYKQLGFEVCPIVMDDGESGKVGVEGNAMTLVKKL